MKSIRYLLTLLSLGVLLNTIAQDTEDGSESEETDEEKENPKVLFDTSLGTFMVELYPDKAPLTVQHFLTLIDDDYYDGLIFHRVWNEFVIQAGSFNQEHEPQNVEETVKNEADNGLSNEKGTIAMARSSDPDSASSDFFINLKNNVGLDPIPKGSMSRREDPHGYAVFGKIIRGMEVVEKIADVKTGSKTLSKQEHTHFPVDNVVIKQASTFE